VNEEVKNADDGAESEHDEKQQEEEKHDEKDKKEKKGKGFKEKQGLLQLPLARVKKNNEN